MIKDLPIYEINIDLQDAETSVSFNSLVSHPAHEKSFQMFAKKQRFEFNDEEQVITGVAISSETPIFRRDESGEEYYVVFSKQSIKDIIFDYARRNNFNNVNLEHNPHEVVKGIYMIHSYQIDEEKGFTAPERFKDENDGSWIVSYKVTDKEIYKRAKAGEFSGFSIEGVFNLKEIKMSKNKFKSVVIDENLAIIDDRNAYSTKEKALQVAKDVGCEDYHEHIFEGKTWYMPCKNHNEYSEITIFGKIAEELEFINEYIRFYNDYPQAVVNNAKRGIELNKKNNNKCAQREGKLRAQQLANKRNISLKTIKRMFSYLSRAETYYDSGDKDSCGYISYLLWGGKAGKRWAESKLKQIEREKK
tara:strand:- start:9093 stop:10175 length:1083 start_codon:yes stop_codon:yes gene_type:complete